jgi:hypothetical protein
MFSPCHVMFVAPKELGDVRGFVTYRRKAHVAMN